MYAMRYILLLYFRNIFYMTSLKEKIIKISSKASYTSKDFDHLLKSNDDDKLYTFLIKIKSKSFISKHNTTIKSSFIDIILSIRLPVSITEAKHVKFYYKDESCACNNLLFELDMIPGKEYSFKDPIPLFVIPFTQIWFEGCDNLEFKYIVVADPDLKKAITLSRAVASTEEVWNFFDDSPKYIIHHGGLHLLEISKNNIVLCNI